MTISMRRFANVAILFVGLAAIAEADLAAQRNYAQRKHSGAAHAPNRPWIMADLPILCVFAALL